MLDLKLRILFNKEYILFYFLTMQVMLSEPEILLVFFNLHSARNSYSDESCSEDNSKGLDTLGQSFCTTLLTVFRENPAWEAAIRTIFKSEGLGNRLRVCKLRTSVKDMKWY